MADPVPGSFQSFTPEQLAFFNQFAAMNALGKAGDISYVPPSGQVTLPPTAWPPQHVQDTMAPAPVPSAFDDNMPAILRHPSQQPQK